MTKVLNTQNSVLAEAVYQLDDARRQADFLAGRIKELQTNVIDLMGEEPSVTVESPDGVLLKATRIQNTRTTINEAWLKTKLGAAMWAKVTTRTLDKKKLEAFVASSEIDPVTIAECSIENKSTPFIKVTDRGERHA